MTPPITAAGQTTDRSTVARMKLLALALGITAVAAAVGGLLWPEAEGGGRRRRDLLLGHRDRVRFDNRDIGLSTHLTEAGVPDLAALIGGSPSAPPPPYTLLDMAGDVEGLLAALELESAHVIGGLHGLLPHWAR